MIYDLRGNYTYSLKGTAAKANKKRNEQPFRILRFYLEKTHFSLTIILEEERGCVKWEFLFEYLAVPVYEDYNGQGTYMHWRLKRRNKKYVITTTNTT